MKRTEIVTAIVLEREKKARARLVRDLTDALESLLQITDGRVLAFRLGYPRANSNREALRAWVAGQIRLSHRQSFESLIAQLESELRRFLNTDTCW